MTREEAIEDFRHSIAMSKLDLKVNKKNMSIEREIMTLNSIARNEMAMKALEQEPIYYPPCIDCNKKMDEIRRAYDKLKEQEPCEDAISRQAGIDIIDNWLSCDGYNEAERHIMRAMRSELYDLPSVALQPKTGHWEQCGYPWEDKFKCSECGEEQPKILCGEQIVGCWSDYCPNCGAKMESEE